MKPLFITFEGLEGAGKSSAIQVVKEFLSQEHIATVITREPGGTEVAEAIRKLLLTHHEEEVASDTELLLFFAGRAQHLARVIKPALQAGKWVISDRFTDTSYAYQGAGRQIPLERIEVLENWVQGDLRPDLTIILDVEIEVGLARARSLGDLDRIEVEKRDFFQRARSWYLERAQEQPERYRVIDAMQSLDKVKEELRQCVKNIIASGNI